MTDAEAAAMLDALTEHFGQTVMPVRRYCEALETWARIIHESGDNELSSAIYAVDNAITKSSLLDRLLYEGEELRTVKCPEHNGVWSGLGPCKHGCDRTGWVRNGWPDEGPRCASHPDRPSLAYEGFGEGGRHLCWDCYRERWVR